MKVLYSLTERIKVLYSLTEVMKVLYSFTEVVKVLYSLTKGMNILYNFTVNGWECMYSFRGNRSYMEEQIKVPVIIHLWKSE